MNKIKILKEDDYTKQYFNDDWQRIIVSLLLLLVVLVIRFSLKYFDSTIRSYWGDEFFTINIILYNSILVYAFIRFVRYDLFVPEDNLIAIGMKWGRGYTRYLEWYYYHRNKIGFYMQEEERLAEEEKRIKALTNEYYKNQQQDLEELEKLRIYKQEREDKRVSLISTFEKEIGPLNGLEELKTEIIEDLLDSYKQENGVFIKKIAGYLELSESYKKFLIRQKDLKRAAMPHYSKRERELYELESEEERKERCNQAIKKEYEEINNDETLSEDEKAKAKERARVRNEKLYLNDKAQT